MKKKLTSTQKLATGVLGAAMFPFILTHETYKVWKKKKYKKRKKKSIF